MAKQQTEQPCYLCGGQAVCTEHDYGKRFFFACSSKTCGAYDITDSVKKLLERDAATRQQLSELAYQARGENLFLDLSLNDKKELVVLLKTLEGRV